MDELVYTSVPRGLAPGTSGYTVVAQTTRIDGRLAQIAKGLSSHSPLDATNPRAHAAEPVNWVHLVADQGVHVVSRIGACPPDHTNRSNFVAHHLLLSPADTRTCPAGPADLLAVPNLFQVAWTGDPRELAPRTLPTPRSDSPNGNAFSAVGLDPGWAESLADRLRDRSVRETWLVYPRGMDMLALIRSVLSHLSPEERWAATFTTLATRTFPGMEFPARLRCVVSEIPYAKEVLGKDGAFDLGSRPAPPPQRRVAAATAPATAAGTPKAKQLPGPAARRPDRPQPHRDPAPHDHTVEPFWRDEPSRPEPSYSLPPPTTPQTSPLSLLPWALMAITTALFFGATYLWITTQNELTATARTLRQQAEDHKKRDDVHARMIATLQAENNKLQAKPDDPKEEPKPPVQNNEPTPGQTVQTVTTSKDKLPDQEPSETGRVETATTEPEASTTPPSKPDIVAGAVDLTQSSLKKPQKLIEKLGKFSIEEGLQLAGAGATFIGHSWVPMKKVKDKYERQLKLGPVKKQQLACKFEYDDNKHELTFGVTGNQAHPLLRFLTVSVQPTGGDSVSIPLGKPFHAKMILTPKVGEGGKPHAEAVDWVRATYSLFSDTDRSEIEDAVNMMNTDSVRSLIEFAADSKVKADKYSGDLKGDRTTKTLLKVISEKRDGVVLQLSGTSPDAKIVGVFSGGGTEEAVLPLINEWDQSTETLKTIPVSTQDRRLIANRNSAKARQEEIRSKLGPPFNAISEFQNLPVRWTLAPPDPNDDSKPDLTKGLIIVDSLPPDTKK
jgi:hypothetical protein